MLSAIKIMTETLHYAISTDGTKIGYRKMGSGQGLIIYHGAGRISQNYKKLAEELANIYTVYIPDRRGRGLSGPMGANYDLTKASQDLISIIKATDADFIFGHSAGGLITLETMLLNSVKKIAVYEPPISVKGSLPSAWLAGFEKALEKKQFKKALAISLKGLKVQEEITKMPFWCLMLLINILALAERKKEKGIRMLDLLHTLPPDMKMAMELDSKYERYRYITIPTLLMAGSKSPSYFHEGIKALENTLQQPTTKIFEGFDHYSPEEKVKEISDMVKEFFSGK